MLSFSGSELTEAQLWPRPIPFRHPTTRIYHVFEMQALLIEFLPWKFVIEGLPGKWNFKVSLYHYCWDPNGKGIMVPKYGWSQWLRYNGALSGWDA